MGTGEVSVTVDGHRLRLSNLDKALYPEDGTTKAEIIDYYSRIAPALLPHVGGRPVTRKRWPDGVGTAADPREPFFAKQLEPGAPAWIPTQTIEHSTGAKGYPLVENVATLVYLSQVASLELHVPQWRFGQGGALQHPDRLVLDLDPGPGAGLAQCAEVAFLARDILRGMGLDPLPLTSGSKGIHLYARLDGRQTSDEVSAVAHALATAIESDHPTLAVSSMAKASREGRVFIDWSQNNGKKTTIAPYSLRGTPIPNAAAPRTWDELRDPDLRQLRFDDVLTRYETDGDLLAALDPTGGPLRVYIDKRRAARTPEPVPASPHVRASDDRRFVIQEHHASALHWDLRLERDGVLVSWAVPKGVPPTSKRNNLAVQTEDHPIEYLDFAGVIPKGEYGAGRMWVLDTGTYTLEKWRDDEVIATLHGSADGPLGDVRIALLRTSGDGEKSSWLLHRMKTTADGGRQTDGAPVVKRAAGDPETDERLGPIRPMLAVAATPGVATAAATRGGRTPWVEFKWDGVRAVGVWQDGALRLWARSGIEITDRYPELTAPGAVTFHADRAIVDGEIVALDGAGRPSFPLLQNRMHLTKPVEISRERTRTPVSYFLFDAVHDDGDLSAAALSERRAHLEHLADGAGAAVSVPPVFDDVDDTLAAARAADLEGVVVKDPRSRYRAGERSETWMKVKLTRTQDVVIGGVRPGKGTRGGSIGSLLVGVYQDDGTLHYAGRVGTGFTEAAATRLLELLIPLGTHEDPFDDVPAADASDAVWVTPTYVGEVEFAEWSPSGHLRHPVWRGLRSDVPLQDVRRED